MAAVVSKTTAAPIERVKFLLRNQEMIKRVQLKTPYMGVRQCFGEVLREEGLFCIWRGNQANLIRYFPSWVNVCWIITTVSGVCAYPFDTLKWRMMLISEQPLRYQNAMHAFHEISRLEGYRPLFRVVTAKMLLGVAGAGVLAGYDWLHRISLRRGYVFDQ